MADKKGNWKSLVQQLATLNLSTRRECDPFWLMISRRLTKRKMESSDTVRASSLPLCPCNRSVFSRVDPNLTKVLLEPHSSRGWPALTTSQVL